MNRVFSKGVLGVTGRPTVEHLFTRSAGRRLAERFVAGERLDDAMRVAHHLNARGMSVSLDRLGEAVSDPAAVDAARDAYVECLERMRSEEIVGNISVKLTQLGLAIDEMRAVRALREVAMAAKEAGTTITVDMEDSSYTQQTIDVYLAVQAELGNLGLAVQAYLHRTPGDVALVAKSGGHIRLCKGAYAESGAVAIQKKAEIREAYGELLEQLIDQPDALPAIATHDGDLIELAAALAADRSREFE